jgi:hypothetical protein
MSPATFAVIASLRAISLGLIVIDIVAAVRPV